MSDRRRSVVLIATSTPPLYGLDIETDTTVNGLDPRVAPVVAVAVTGNELEVVFDGPEDEILAHTDELFDSLPPGVIVTWNGASFDLPFLAFRASRLDRELGLRLHLDPAIAGGHDPLPGHAGAYRATWFTHSHLDGYQLYRADVGASLNLSCGLKALARFVGLPVVEVDRERIHELTEAHRREYVASDAHLARLLVARRPAALSAVDQPFTSSG